MIYATPTHKHSVQTAKNLWQNFEKSGGAAEVTKFASSQFSWLIVVFDQWLHRSAFSFGGIEKPTNTELRGPSRSQVPGNLVLGTKETNTKMIRSVTIADPCTVYLTELNIIGKKRS